MDDSSVSTPEALTQVCLLPRLHSWDTSLLYPNAPAIVCGPLPTKKRVCPMLCPLDLRPFVGGPVISPGFPQNDATTKGKAL